ncbi:hypothetical protein TNCV_3450741 [Trichonephila clavipes]|uniref:Uncharacterized protein n=1 Tax=Trichonephila clavipes TaxID=2585209 RepID=A0A8X6WME1_TRICX|nr:hypothetical protein TNCV_3450741 [Trichonephila clavipes]
MDNGMRRRTVEWLEAGLSQILICREFNLRPNVVFTLWKQFQTIELIEKKHGHGHPTTTIAREDRHLSIIVVTGSRVFSLTCPLSSLGQN